MAAPSILEPLRPKPFRGDVIAAGVVVLTTFVWLLRFRFDNWSDGVHLLYAAAALGLVGAMAVLAPMEREAPRAYQSVLYIASVALALLALVDLGEVLGADGGAGEIMWVSAGVAASALVFAVGRNSAVSTLLAAIAGGTAGVAFVVWVSHSESTPTIGWVLVVVMVVFAVLALANRDRRPAHAVALVEAAGVAAVAIGVIVGGDAILEATFSAETGDDRIDVSWGWELLLLGAGFGLVAYSAVERERGPAWLGVLCLAIFAVLSSSGGFLGWLLLLLTIAALLLIIGLRPTTPAPPPPDADAPPAPAEPLRP